MDTVTVSGVVYVKTSKAARQAGYTADYVGQLCRKGALDAIVLGKTWYVSEASLSAHKDSQRRTNTGLTRRDIEQQKHILQGARSSRGNGSGLSGGVYCERLLEAPIRYVSDASELLPAIPRPTAPSDALSGPDSAVFVRRIVPESHEDSLTMEEPLSEETTEETEAAVGNPVLSELYQPYFDDKEDAVEASREPVRSGFFGISFLIILLVMFGMVSVAVESSWQYTATGAGEFVFSTSYNLASVSNTIWSLRDIKFDVLK